jgi:hypothetical protein
VEAARHRATVDGTINRSMERRLLDSRHRRGHRGSMSERLQLRRHLYEELAHTRRRRGRRALHWKISVLSRTSGAGPDDGAAGVREPRRPYPPKGPAARALEL